MAGSQINLVEEIKRLACSAKVTWGLNSEIIKDRPYTAGSQAIMMYASDTCLSLLPLDLRATGEQSQWLKPVEKVVNILSDSRSSLELLRDQRQDIHCTRGSTRHANAEGKEIRFYWLRARGHKGQRKQMNWQTLPKRLMPTMITRKFPYPGNLPGEATSDARSLEPKRNEETPLKAAPTPAPKARESKQKLQHCARRQRKECYVAQKQQESLGHEQGVALFMDENTERLGIGFEAHGERAAFHFRQDLPTS
ncbi:hypothetical protein EVAR_53729_1 [Eumeta japonica]|uniref:Uncharacterized protein n=1 Tax=Eumeta variegata TaxID=151549 RepID=A0A4C1Z3Y3_EUMVA|nr:hypothetical protein EVAR_53729_1 [Eumeta japonica]